MSTSPLHIAIAGPPDAPTATARTADGSLAPAPLDRTARPALRRLLDSVRAGQDDLGSAAAVGRGLFAMLFTRPLRDLYRQARARLGDDERLRLALRIDLPELADLPWEWLCDPQAPSPAAGFLALDSAILLTRDLPQPRPAAPVTRSGPLRVLAVCAAPAGQPPLDLARELRVLGAALAGLPPAQVTLGVLATPAIAQAAGLSGALLGPPTPAAFAAALAAGYDVLHYAGHAAVQRPGAILALEDEIGNMVPVDVASLAGPAQAPSLRLAVLPACAPAGAGTGVAGALLPMAPALGGAGLGAVVALQFRIPDDSAVAFARAFCQALSRNQPVTACVDEARKAVRVEELNVRAGWGSPVLFLPEASDGNLWLSANTPATAGGPSLDSSAPAQSGGSVQQGGIQFRGPTSIGGPVISGDVGSLTVGDIVAGDKIAVGDVSGTGVAIGRGAAASVRQSAGADLPGAPADRAAQVAPAFAALIAAIADPALLAPAAALRAELLAPRPSWPRLAALRAALAPADPAALAAFFGDPAVQPIVAAAQRRAPDDP